MAEYIEREAALLSLTPIVKRASERNRNIYSAVKQCVEAINCCPAVDVVPVRHAIWRYKTMTVPGGRGQTYAKWSCTACKAKQKERSNYCPNCGARMDGDEE